MAKEPEPHWKRLIRKGDLPGLEHWLVAGGNVNERDTRDGHVNTPVGYAANKGKLAVVRFLVERGADPIEGEAFLGAVIGASPEVARYLWPLGIDEYQVREAASILELIAGDQELVGQIRERVKELNRERRRARAAEKRSRGQKGA